MSGIDLGRSNDFGAKMLWRILWVIEARGDVLEPCVWFEVQGGGLECVGGEG